MSHLMSHVSVIKKVLLNKRFRVKLDKGYSKQEIIQLYCAVQVSSISAVLDAFMAICCISWLPVIRAKLSNEFSASCICEAHNEKENWKIRENNLSTCAANVMLKLPVK